MADTSDFITPTKEQLREWESLIFDQEENVDVVLIQAFKAGANQELEACCEWLTSEYDWGLAAALRLDAARRPEPQTLNDIAQQMLGTIERDARYLPEITDTIRKALEEKAGA